MKFVDDYNKELKWYNRNFVFLGTILMVALILLCEFVVKKDVTKLVSENIFVSTALDPFITGSKQKAVVSAVFMLVAGLYLERYWGTIKYVVVSLVLCPIITMLVLQFGVLYILQNPTKELAFSGLETSVLPYALFGFVIITTIFHLKKYLFDKTHSIFNWLLLAVIIVTMCTIFPAELVEDKYVEYIKAVKFTTFENLTKNYVNLISISFGAVIAFVCEVFTIGLTAGGSTERVEGGKPKKSKGKKHSGGDTGLTFADIMEKENKEQGVTTEQTATTQENVTPVTNNSAQEYLQQNNYGTGVASGFNTAPPPQPTTNTATTSEEPNRIKVGETLKQYSDYNEYINEKMKNLNAKTKK